MVILIKYLYRKLFGGFLKRNDLFKKLYENSNTIGLSQMTMTYDPSGKDPNFKNFCCSYCFCPSWYLLFLPRLAPVFRGLMPQTSWKPPELF